METTSAWRWASLGGVDPLALTSARRLAHRAAQWATRAARANLPAAADDSHSALTWKASERALLSAALGGTGGDARVGVRLNPLDLVFAADDDFGSMLRLRELSDGEAQMWLDTALARRGLKKAGGVALPYEVEGDDPRARYAAERERPGLAELSRWFGAAAETLENLRFSFAALKPGPLLLWPHHFDIATLVQLDPGNRSIGVGFSPGDEFYPQPYFYVSPYPRPETPPSGRLDPIGHWHTEGFVGAIATGGEILQTTDRGAAIAEFLHNAFESARAQLRA